MANGLTVGAINLEATFNSISVEAVYTGDDNGNSSCVMEVSPAGAGTWAAIINYPIPWQDFAAAEAAVNTTGPRAYYGKAHRLTANTSYDIRCTFTDADGVTGTNPQTATLSTRVDSIPAAASLTPTHFISPTGVDTAAGTAIGTPWRTLARVYWAALSAGSDMIVQAAPGHYTAIDAHSFGWATNGHALTIYALNPAVTVASNNYGGEVWQEPIRANQGSRSIIEGRGDDGFPNVFGPTGTTDADLTPVGRTDVEAISTSTTATRTLATLRVAPWVQVSLAATNGLADGVARTVWKATAPSTGINQLEYATTRDGTYQRVPNWCGDLDFDSNGPGAGGTITQLNPGVWSQVVLSSQNVPNGFLCMFIAGRVGWTEGGSAASTNTSDVYLVMPADAPHTNPNQLWWKMGGGLSNPVPSPFRINGANIRFSGFEATTAGYYGPVVDSGATFAIIDHCLIRGHFDQIVFLGIRATNTRSADTVIQYNRLEDSRLTAQSGPNAANDALLIPWFFIKTWLYHGSPIGSQTKAGKFEEAAAIYGNDGWGRRNVIRFNAVDHTFDFIASYYANSVDRYNGYGSDIHGNLLFGTGDDITDLSRWEVNVSVYDNRGENNKSGFCSAPHWGGPVYYFDNVVWRLGSHMTGRIKLPDPFEPTSVSGTQGAQVVKYGGDSPNPRGRQIYVNNTFWSDETSWNPSLGPTDAAGQGGSGTPIFYWRNNIVRCMSTVFFDQDVLGATTWDEDYNDWSWPTSIPASPKIIRTWAGDWDYFKTGTNGGANYQQVTGKGAHSNARANVNIAVDPEMVSPTTGDLRLVGGSALLTAGVALGNITGAAPVRLGRRPGTLSGADVTPPVLSAVASSGIGSTFATITWTTDENATSQVSYGLTSGYGTSTTEILTLGLSHTVNITGLLTNTVYHFQCRSKDAAGNQGTATDATFTTLADAVFPVISGVGTSAISSTSASLVWTTDKPCNSQADYGPTSGYGTTTTLAPALVTSHVVALAGLTPSTTYHYDVRSADAAANTTTSPDFTFTTAAAGGAGTHENKPRPHKSRAARAHKTTPHIATSRG